MFYRFLADAVIVIHFFFILFVVFGGLFIFKWKKAVWLHVPAALYGALIEFFGWICPLTYLEVWLLEKGGMESYGSGFIEHYVVPVIYPESLTKMHHVILGLVVIVLNLLIYGWIIFKKVSHRATNGSISLTILNPERSRRR
ncbi:MAG: DUF2784 domain-containing protein, partial [Candidatus Aureabacteria bacterium]|nr:DUF2784 domain-containing protein [Candidatus Auribacterota bacterium]